MTRDTLPSSWKCHGPALRLEGVGVRYGRHWALRGVDLDIWRGDILAFIGPNGAGKSTLLRAILGLARLAEGCIIQNEDAPSARIGYVPQKLEFDPEFPITVEEFLSLNLPRGPLAWLVRPLGRERNRILEALELLHVAHLARQKLGTLSGGQFQRVLLAAALLQGPDLLLLDEPAASIDRRGSEDLRQLLKEIHQRLGLTIVFVSHDLHFVHGLATRVGCLNQSFCGLGTPEEILCEHFLAETYGAAFQVRVSHFH